MLDLAQFTGSQTFQRHGLVRRILLTEGAVALAESRGAWWLLDIIATEGAMLPQLKAEPWQSWKMAVADSRAEIVVDDGNGQILHRKSIDWTDYPEPEAELWLIDGTVLLPSEY